MVGSNSFSLYLLKPRIYFHRYKKAVTSRIPLKLFVMRSKEKEDSRFPLHCLSLCVSPMDNGRRSA